VVHRPLQEILRDLNMARKERQKADEELIKVLGKLGFGEDVE
jgi:hypothetical protein